MRRLPRVALVGAPVLMVLAAFAQVPAVKAPANPMAQPAAIKAQTSAPTPSHPLEQADLTAFFDGILPLQLERSDIAGASVLVMKDGKVLLQKGYGYADVKSKKAVDPASTIFRLASIVRSPHMRLFMPQCGAVFGLVEFAGDVYPGKIGFPWSADDVHRLPNNGGRSQFHHSLKMG